MGKILFILLTLLCVSCTTTEVAERTARTITAPVRTVETVGKNGGKIITNYYSTLEELNEDNQSDKIIFWKKEF
jgi:hypothetical protein